MIRYILKLHDRSTAGGKVVEGIDHFFHHGTPITFLGAKVYCPACKTTGFIGARGPRWSGDIMGKQEALSGDVCYCACKPPPVMLASQQDSFHTFDGEALAKLGYDAYGRRLAEQAVRIYDECVRLKDRRTGKPLANVRYRVLADGQVMATGRTDAAGRTQRIKTRAAETLEIQVSEE